MYERILLPTDGQRGAEEAIRHAVELAAACDATLFALSVVDKDVYGAYTGDEYVDERESAEATLEALGGDAFRAIEDAAASAGVAVRTELRYGTPASEIVDYAGDADADLIVVGTERRPSAYRELLGSVTERVVRLSERPVTVVKTAVE